jgi:ABC-2 type transport system permease protein
MRSLFGGSIGDPAVWQGLLIVSVLAVVTVLWSARLFTRAVR